MRLVVTVIHRGAPQGEDGLVYVVDWETKTVLRTFQPPGALVEDYPDDGGGPRGYRGVCFARDLCYVASADTLYGYDSSWELRHQVTHPLFADLHEIAWDGDAFWVTSTGIDAVLRVSLEGTLLDEFFLGELPSGDRELLGIPERSIDRTSDHRMLLYPGWQTHVAHPNGVQIVNGQPYITLFLQGAVISLDPLTVLWQDDRYYGSHSGRLIGEDLHLAASFQTALLVAQRTNGTSTEISIEDDSFTDSRGRVKKALQGAVIAIDSRGGLLRELLRRAPSRLNPQPLRDRPGWARGLRVIDDRHVLVGSSPASVALVDTEQQTVVERIVLSERMGDAVFAVEVDERVA